MSQHHFPFVSVIMPIRNEVEYVERSLSAVLRQDYPEDRFEVIVADGTSTDGTLQIIWKIQSKWPQLRLVENPGKIVATGLNAAISRARGEVIVRVDGHCEIAPHYVRRCVEHLRSENSSVVGGPIETVGETPLARVIAAAMSSPFGVGNSAFRTTRHKTLLVDTVPFPAYKRSVIEEAGFADEELVRNQDDEYNYRIRKLGGRVLLAADVTSRYYSRSTLFSLARQYYQYGYWKVRVLQKHPHQMSLRQFVPPAFVASLMISLALISWQGSPIPLLFILVPYGLANLGASLWTAHMQGWGKIFLLPVVFAILHLGYGLGFLWGLLRFSRRWLRD